MTVPQCLVSATDPQATPAQCSPAPRASGKAPLPMWPIMPTPAQRLSTAVRAIAVIGFMWSGI